MTTVQTYATQQLAATGFAVIDYRAAMLLRPDLWPSAGMVCRGEFGQACNQARRLNIPGAKLYRFNINGIGPVDVLARCADDLASRMRLVMGMTCAELPAGTEEPEPPVVVTNERAILLQAKRNKLRRLASQEPPAHECSLRRDILAARAELERMPAEDAKPEAAVSIEVVSTVVSATVRKDQS